MKISKKVLIVSTISALGVSGAIAQRALTKDEKAIEQQKILSDVLNKVNAKLEGIEKQIPGLRTDLGEHIIDGESQAIENATEAVVKTVLLRGFQGATPGVAKGDHGKTLACLKGNVKFFSEIPENLQKGVVVPGAEYKVEARLSNAEEPGRSDRSSLSQGVALKLKNISKNVGHKARLPDFPKADEQDFLMTSAPIFFLSNIVEYSTAFGLRAETDSLVKLKTLFKNAPMLAPRLGEEISAKIRSFIAAAPNKPQNIMTHPYWSKHPYAWGEASEGGVAVKYSVAPCENAAGLKKESRKADYQQEFISGAFEKNKEICFYFRVQARPANATEKSLPIEDGNVEWKEDAAPFVNIAKVVFKADDNKGWDSKEAQAACGRTEFTPWNGLMAHQPMSNLARGRRYVYKASALVREMKDQLDPEIQKVR